MMFISHLFYSCPFLNNTSSTSSEVIDSIASSALVRLPFLLCTHIVISSIRFIWLFLFQHSLRLICKSITSTRRFDTNHCKTISSSDRLCYAFSQSICFHHSPASLISVNSNHNPLQSSVAILFAFTLKSVVIAFWFILECFKIISIISDYYSFQFVNRDRWIDFLINSSRVQMKMPIDSNSINVLDWPWSMSSSKEKSFGRLVEIVKIRYSFSISL